MGKTHIQQWQRKLKSRNEDVGRIDGDFGPRTLKASLATIEPKKKVPAEHTKEPDKSAIEEPLSDKSKPPFNSVPIGGAGRTVHTLINHCTATPEGREYSVGTIRRWHQSRGWSDIGYHFVVHLNGKISIGRPISKVGAHVRGFNTGSIGIAYVGGVAKDGKTAKDTRTPAQRQALLWLNRELAKHYGVKRIAGHNEYAAKACPSFDVRNDELGNIPGFKKGKKTWF